MRKIIETKMTSLIVCDNPKCDFEIPYSEEQAKNIIYFINMPCPLCDENLLTVEDYLQHERLIKILKWINKWFSWITVFYSKKTLSKGKIVSVHVHKGIKIKDETDSNK